MCYDCFTVGAFAAAAQKFRHGGLRRLIRQLRDQLTAENTEETRLEQVYHVLNDITMLQKAVDRYCDEVCRSAVQGDSADLNNCMAVLADKVACVMCYLFKV